ncbi:MAG: GlcNAc-transferase family protein, partial [Arenicellales bacterium]
MEKSSSTIFVQIASYRDPELPKTIQSCLANAHFPENLRFGICWQYDSQTIHDMDAFNHDNRFRIDKINYQDSKGCCWARNRVNRLYQEETYTLQIDAHMRFAPEWDSLLIGMIEGIRDTKPLITTYPPSYSIVNGEEVLSDVTTPQKLKLKRLHLDLTTRLEGVSVTDSNQPGKSEYIAAGYFFTLGQFCKEVEYDPNLYFLGEEINLAVRAYSNGYNFYYPNKNLVWHLYGHGASLHWSDHPDQEHIQHATAIDRLEKLLLHDSNDLEQYGLGKERTLKDYEQYANICFSEVLERRKLAKPEIPFHHRIRLNTSEIEVRNDYHYWVFCLLNEEDIEIYRQDIKDPDVLNHRVNEIAINTLLPSMPTQYKLWPKHREWGPELIYPLYFLTDTSKTTEIEKLPVQPRVFVALAAYCEPELVLTIQNCLNRAQFPERLTFGICLQFDDDGPPEIQQTCLDDYENDERFRIVKYPYQDSQGGCWARNIVQSLYRDEEYTLQVDSHTRFLANWDIALINMMQVFPSAKPLITGFPPLYFYENEKENLIDFYHLERVPTTLVESWSEDGWVYHPTRYLPQNTKTPRRCRILSGAFVFTLGRWNYEVNQDPYHLYTGEEFALTLRSYTHGYDLFNPLH